MRLYIALILTLLSFFALSPLAADVLSNEKTKEIHLYLKNNDDMHVVVDEATKDFETKMTLLQESYQKDMSDVEISERFFEIMQEEFDVMINSIMQKHLAEINNVLFNFMHENFTLEELKELNDFHSQGVGKKLLEHEPEIYRLSAEMSREIMTDAAPVFQERIDSRIEEEGIELFIEKPRQELSQAIH